jgi:hypothetical protein
MMMPQMMSNMMRDQPAMGALAGGASGGTSGGGGASACVHAVQQQVDPFAKIKQLKELLDIGAISPQEFDAKKAELMKMI